MELWTGCPVFLDMLFNYFRKTTAFLTHHNLDIAWLPCRFSPQMPSSWYSIRSNWYVWRLMLYLFFINLSFPLNQKNNLSVKGISVSDIKLFIHLLHVGNIKIHLIIIKLLTQITLKQESTVSPSFVALLLSPFHLMKSKFNFPHFNELNKHHPLNFLVFMLFESFASTHVNVHCEALISGSDTCFGCNHSHWPVHLGDI